MKILLLGLLGLIGLQNIWCQSLKVNLSLNESPYVLKIELERLDAYVSDLDSDDPFYSEAYSLKFKRDLVFKISCGYKNVAEKVFKSYFEDRPNFTQEQLKIIRDRIFIRWLMTLCKDGIVSITQYNTKFHNRLPWARYAISYKEPPVETNGLDFSYNGVLNRAAEECLYSQETTELIGWSFEDYLTLALAKLDMNDSQQSVTNSMKFFRDAKDKEFSEIKNGYRLDMFNSPVTYNIKSKVSTYTGD